MPRRRHRDRRRGRRSSPSSSPSASSSPTSTCSTSPRRSATTRSMSSSLPTCWSTYAIPQRVLTACLRHLRPEGEVLLSIPNVATPTCGSRCSGATSSTSGAASSTRRTCASSPARPLRRSSPIAARGPPLGPDEASVRRDRDRVGPAARRGLLDWVAAQPDADTYQFVLRAAGAAGSHLRSSATRVHQLLAASHRRASSCAVELERLDGRVKASAGRARRGTPGDGRRSAVALTAAEDVPSASAAQTSRSGVGRARAAGRRGEGGRGAPTSATSSGRRSTRLPACRRSSWRYAARRASASASVLAPFGTTRRVARAWRRAKSPADG